MGSHTVGKGGDWTEFDKRRYTSVSLTSVQVTLPQFCSFQMTFCKNEQHLTADYFLQHVMPVSGAFDCKFVNFLVLNCFLNL